MKGRDELLADAIYLQSKGYFKDMPIMELTGMLAKNKHVNPGGNTSAGTGTANGSVVSSITYVSGEHSES